MKNKLIELDGSISVVINFVEKFKSLFVSEGLSKELLLALNELILREGAVLVLVNGFEDLLVSISVDLSQHLFTNKFIHGFSEL